VGKEWNRTGFRAMMLLVAKFKNTIVHADRKMRQTMKDSSPPSLLASGCDSFQRLPHRLPNLVVLALFAHRLKYPARSVSSSPHSVGASGSRRGAQSAAVQVPMEDLAGRLRFEFLRS
jgi:hypothetical protein